MLLDVGGDELTEEIAREVFDTAEPARKAGMEVAAGARVIMAAALIMMSVFGSFVLNDDPTVKQFGVGFSVGVALAAVTVLLLRAGAARARRGSELVDAGLARSRLRTSTSKARQPDGIGSLRRKQLRLRGRHRRADRPAATITPTAHPSRPSGRRRCSAPGGPARPSETSHWSPAAQPSARTPGRRPSRARHFPSCETLSRACAASIPRSTAVLVAILAESVRRLSEQVTEAYYLSADDRVLRRLADLAELRGGTVPLPHEALAELAGTSRATVNRVLRAKSSA